MHDLETIVLLMSGAVIIVGIALKLNIAYPIALIIGGCFLGFIPHLSPMMIDPSLMLLIVLPPILYYAAYSISFRESKHNLRIILHLALGLVLVTTVVLGVLFKWLLPEVPWPLAFAFGAILSPPDAVAATAILRRFNISHRLLSILEGESLVNDATGLVLYRFAVVALLSGTFSLPDATFDFIKVTVGGILIGGVTGFIFHKLAKYLFDAVLTVVFSFTIPYIVYILADLAGVSGVLAVVVNGLIGARLFITEYSSLSRVVGWTTWNVIIILLNCFVFILIGAQLPRIIQGMTSQQFFIYSGYALFLTFAMVAVRFIWVYANLGIVSLWTLKQKRSRFRKDSRNAIIISWSGMRGIVSLTAALALPITLSDGTHFPGRDVTIFIAFIVILLSLLIPGLTLPFVIRRLNVYAKPKTQVVAYARIQLIQIAEVAINHLYEANNLDDKERSFLLNYFKSRHRILALSAKTEESSYDIEGARRNVIQSQRQHLIEMWEKQEIEDHVLNRLERELDLEEEQLARAEM